MKKFFRILFFLLALAGAGIACIAGFVAFKIPSGKIGIVSSKTKGVDKRIFKNGTFSFCREFLIPNNATLFIFEPKAIEISGEKSKTLENAAIYSKLIPGGADFDYSFSYKISASVKEEFFSELVEKNLAKSQDDADSFLRQRLDALLSAAENYFQKGAQLANAPKSLELQDGGEAAAIADSFDDLKILRFSAKIEKAPDMALYSAAVEAHKKYVENVKTKLEESIAAKADSSANDFYEIERATRWAQAIREYPEIKDFINSEYCKNLR